jgi:hypothetical protein
MMVRSFFRRCQVWLRSLSPREAPASAGQGVADAPMRLLVVANAVIPTVQLSIIYPLEMLINSGQCRIDLLTEQEMKLRFGKALRNDEVAAWIAARVSSVNPTHLVFCRYSGPHAESILVAARTMKIPTVYCIDDDLLNVPIELGRKKFEYHNHPLRLDAVRHLLNNVDVVYCSNDRLKSHLQRIGIQGALFAGEIFCAGEVVCPAELRSVITIGYMGFDHAHDFQIVLPALVKVLQKYPFLRFELFGKIPRPPELDQFGSRVINIDVVADYREFLGHLGSRRWDIGICPLAPSDFNRVKNINKWVEYTSVGAAVVATRGMIYDDCCSEGCGLLVEHDEWESAFSTLIDDPGKRLQLVLSAQGRLTQSFLPDSLCRQLLSILQLAEKQFLSKNNKRGVKNEISP